MTRKSIRAIAAALVASCIVPAICAAQTSSLGAQKRKDVAAAQPGGAPPGPAAGSQSNQPGATASGPPSLTQKLDAGATSSSRPRANADVERYSWISLQPRQPRQYRINDLVTVVIREQRTFEADALQTTDKAYKLETELNDFLKLTGGGVGAAAFRRGKPNVDFNYRQNLRSRGDTSREDRLTTRITCRVIDVKPNGQLVLEGKGKISHDEEVSTITITGSCRKDDVTQDNTILSTQMADKVVNIENSGAVRDAARRGWLHKLIDWVNPI